MYHDVYEVFKFFADLSKEDFHKYSRRARVCWLTYQIKENLNAGQFKLPRSNWGKNVSAHYVVATAAAMSRNQSADELSHLVGTYKDSAFKLINHVTRDAFLTRRWINGSGDASAVITALALVGIVQTRAKDLEHSVSLKKKWFCYPNLQCRLKHPSMTVGNLGVCSMPILSEDYDLFTRHSYISLYKRLRYLWSDVYHLEGIDSVSADLTTPVLQVNSSGKEILRQDAFKALCYGAEQYSVKPHIWIGG